MSGTSGDGVDASLINSDGDSSYKVEINKYFEYENNFSQKIHSLKDKINTVTDLETYSSELKALERELTIFHSKVVMDIICLLYTSPSPRDWTISRMPSSA